jgi:hypothetical protein
MVGGFRICDPIDDRGRNHRHCVEGGGRWLLVPRAHPWCPRCRRWRGQGRHEDRADLLRRKTVSESAGQHDRRERLLDVAPPPKTRPHLSGTSPWVMVAIVTVRGGGGAAAGATTAAATACSMSCHRRWRRNCRKWSSSAIGGGGVAHQWEAQLT